MFFLLLFYSSIFFLDPTLLFDDCYADLNIAGNIMRTINGIKTNKLNTDTVHNKCQGKWNV